MSDSATLDASIEWQSRIVGTADVDPATLIDNPANWRLHPLAQRSALVALLETIGWISSVIVNRTTGHIVDGHLRAREARDAGEATIPVTYVDLTPDEERTILAMLDPLRGMAALDPAKEAALLQSVTTSDERLQALYSQITAALPEPAAEDDQRAAAAADVEAPEKKPAVEFKVAIGAYHFVVGLAEYTAWVNALFEAVGGDDGAVTAELYRRLGLDVIMDSLPQTRGRTASG
jgi:hypothetical protein